MAKLSRRRITSQERKKIIEDLAVNRGKPVQVKVSLQIKQNSPLEPDTRPVDDMRFDDNGIIGKANVSRINKRPILKAEINRRIVLSKKGKS